VYRDEKAPGSILRGQTASLSSERDIARVFYYIRSLPSLRRAKNTASSFSGQRSPAVINGLFSRFNPKIKKIIILPHFNYKGWFTSVKYYF
jgi:hypothetical protein